MAKSTGNGSETTGNEFEAEKAGIDIKSGSTELDGEGQAAGGAKISLIDHLREVSFDTHPDEVIFTEPKALLDYLHENKGTDLSNVRFSVQAEGLVQDFRGVHPDLALEALVFCKRPQEDHLTNAVSNLYAKQLNSMLPVNNQWLEVNNFIDSVLDALATLNLASVIKFHEDKLKLSFRDISLKSYNKTAEVSPFVFEYICDSYSKKLSGFGESGYSIIYKNLLSFFREVDIKDGDKVVGHPVTTGLLKIKVDNGVFESDLTNYFTTQLSLCETLFFRVILPLVMLDNGVKKSFQSTLLSEDVLETKREIIRAVYICFLSKIDFVRSVLNVASAKLSDIATLDYNPDAGAKKKTSSAVKVEVEGRNEWFYPTKNEYESELVGLNGKTSSSKDVEKLDALGKKYSNLQNVIDYIKPYVRYSYLKSLPLSFPPLLIAGPPGIGKSKFMQELFDALGFTPQTLHSSQFTSGWSLVGMQTGWNSAHQGIVAKTMQDQMLYNPLICFDEVDKIQKNNEHVSVESALMRLLEPIEAKNFRDAHFNAPHDVSGVNWIFSCNQPRMMQFALRSRMHTIFVYPPTKRKDIDNIHMNIWMDLIKQENASDEIYSSLSPDILDDLAEEYYDELQFRASSQRLEKAMKVLISSLEPGFKKALSLNDLLDPKGSTVIKPIVLH
ncbi:AAA family ATPase [Pseudomonas serbica]|uniref:AAA family ATPase n=1 Tax=Pseudomonas serbica TaxID=2965074 RepID=UPI00237B267C|nr:AAA family ATPase [Pseudomonas serbica]